jgi:hypothetical protein
MKERLFYLVDANVAIPLRNPFKIQKKFVETVNFVPELLPGPGHDNVLMMNSNGIVAKGETRMPELDFLMENDSISRMKSPFSPSESFLRLMDDADEDEDDDEWDEDEDEADDDDDDDEEWDEDDDEWDEDEDWDDEDDDEEDDDWEDEEVEE